MKVLNFISKEWKFHRNGWKYVVDNIKNKFHNENGLPFYSWVDGEFSKKKPILHEWAGILHNSIEYPLEYYSRKDINILSLSDLIKQSFFQESMKKCKFLLTLSPTTANFLLSNKIKAYYVFHPCPITINWKKFNGNVITIGQWLRRIEAISEIDTNFKKIIVKVPWNEPYEKIKINKNVQIKNFIENKKYDQLIMNSVVFLNMYDIAACNTLLECIMGNVPIMINRLPGAEDYLGKDYPFFYKSLSDVSQMLSYNKILEAHLYLKNKDKEFLSIESMEKKIQKIINKYFYLKMN